MLAKECRMHLAFVRIVQSRQQAYAWVEWLEESPVLRQGRNEPFLVESLVFLQAGQ